jgi:hypothetical protein
MKIIFIKLSEINIVTWFVENKLHAYETFFKIKLKIGIKLECKQFTN